METNGMPKITDNIYNQPVPEFIFQEMEKSQYSLMLVLRQKRQYL
jgi:alanine-alpha-ketoisovalerate/valine-pyruvate aminotransferase